MRLFMTCFPLGFLWLTLLYLERLPLGSSHTLTLLPCLSSFSRFILDPHFSLVPMSKCQVLCTNQALALIPPLQKRLNCLPNKKQAPCSLSLIQSILMAFFRASVNIKIRHLCNIMLTHLLSIFSTEPYPPWRMIFVMFIFFPNYTCYTMFNNIYWNILVSNKKSKNVSLIIMHFYVYD